MLIDKENIDNLIQELKKYDNNAGYRLDYTSVKNRLNPIVEELIALGDTALEELHQLIKSEETWSCLFSLEILEEIKSEKSIHHLISFIKKNEDSDYFEGCEDAMLGLSNIGGAAIDPLMIELESNFNNKKHYTYLSSALGRIKNGKVYYFMKKITEEYIDNPKKYEGWFNIAMFTYEFESQGKKEILPLLKSLSKMKQLSHCDKLEIRDTIKIIEDPEDFKEKCEKDAERLRPIFNEIFKNKKIGRNEPCPCGSGKKYKRCCLEKDGERLGLWSEKSYVQTLSTAESDYNERMKYFQQKPNDPKEHSCKKCNTPIGKHNIYWHEGMCDDCFFDQYDM